MIDFLIGNLQFELITSLLQSKVILELYDMEIIEAQKFIYNPKFQGTLDEF